MHTHIKLKQYCSESDEHKNGEVALGRLFSCSLFLIKLFEEFLDLSVSHVVVEYATKFCIYDKNNASLEDIVMAKMLVNHGLFCRLYLTTLLRSSSIVAS